MNGYTIENVADGWCDFAGAALRLQKVPLSELQNLLKDTYEVLHFFCRFDVVPKEISRMLLEMKNFLSFAAPEGKSDDKKSFYEYQTIYIVVKALEDGFFCGEYECAFPVLKVCDLTGDVHVIDLEKDCLEELL